jgi:hydroxymethylbilane synthase
VVERAAGRGARPPSRARDVVRIATRASELALRQARTVEHALAQRGAATELVTFRTAGDKRLDEPLRTIGGKGLFTAELERALAAGRVDCCVHSLKDLPTESPAGLALGAVLEREDPRDVLVVHDAIPARSLADLPRGSRVGTSSLRRRAQLYAARPDLDVVELRGNVPTRLRKVDEGQVQAAVLAAAGLHRLDVRQRIDAWLDPPGWLPAAGQGAIAVQVRAGDSRMRELLWPLHHAPTAVATRAERALLAALGGGCQVPVGALATDAGGRLVLHALVADVRGRQVVRGSCEVDSERPELAAEWLAADLRARGAEAILAELRALDHVPTPQPE